MLARLRFISTQYDHQRLGNCDDNTVALTPCQYSVRTHMQVWGSFLLLVRVVELAVGIVNEVLLESLLHEGGRLFCQYLQPICLLRRVHRLR